MLTLGLNAPREHVDEIFNSWDPDKSVRPPHAGAPYGRAELDRL